MTKAPDAPPKPRGPIRLTYSPRPGVNSETLPKLTLIDLVAVAPPAPPVAAQAVTVAAVAPAPRTSPSQPAYAAHSAAQGGGGAGGVWACIRAKESGGNYSTSTGNGHYGAYQFSESTWRSIGGTGYPNQASPAVQDAMAQRLQQRSGWGQWSTHSMCGV